MNAFIHSLNILLPILYLVTIFLYSQAFFYSSRFARKYKSGVLEFTVLVHLGRIVLSGVSMHRYPITNFFEFASVLALAIALIYLYIEYRLKLKTTGLFILSVVFPLQLFSSLFYNPSQPLPKVLHSPMLIFHTSTVILGYAALFVSALYGLMYLLLFYELKSAQFGVIYRKMPSLEELSELNIRAATIGFFFLSITIVLGILWRKSAFPGAAHFDPQVIGTYLVWVIYGLVIFGKKIAGWTGKWLAYMSLGGFVIIIVSMIVVNWVVKSFHQFG